MATAMDQRDGVTAVTATRYPFGSQEERRRRGGHGPARSGGGGRAPSRRHGRHSLRSAAQPMVPAAPLGAVVLACRPARLRRVGPSWASAGACRLCAFGRLRASRRIIVRASSSCFRFAFDQRPPPHDAQHQPHSPRPSPKAEGWLGRRADALRPELARSSHRRQGAAILRTPARRPGAALRASGGLRPWRL